MRNRQMRIDRGIDRHSTDEFCKSANCEGDNHDQDDDDEHEDGNQGENHEEHDHDPEESEGGGVQCLELMRRSEDRVQMAQRE